MQTSACCTVMASLQRQGTMQPLDPKLGLGTANSSSHVPLRPCLHALPSLHPSAQAQLSGVPLVP